MVLLNVGKFIQSKPVKIPELQSFFQAHPETPMFLRGAADAGIRRGLQVAALTSAALLVVGVARIYTGRDKIERS
eukprot:TRINITY_DN136359_c0_g1_i1.p2 TRINITY_DN136359_c0_g1~~TRINITY_DN136359_c0_g1_i1.p2  ORF type:complete len:75 (-),score=36.54 TRINITY_DN136359_c0_g1_i1:57-281(-)